MAVVTLDQCYIAPNGTVYQTLTYSASGESVYLLNVHTLRKRWQKIHTVENWTHLGVAIFDQYSNKPMHSNKARRPAKVSEFATMEIDT